MYVNLLILDVARKQKNPQQPTKKNIFTIFGYTMVKMDFYGPKLMQMGQNTKNYHIMILWKW